VIGKRRLCGPRDFLTDKRKKEKKKSLALPGIDPRYVGSAACSLDIIPTTVFQLPATTNVMKIEHSRY